MSANVSFPLLPLRGMMIFPYMIIHFDVGRKRSIAAVEQAMLADKKIFLVAQRDENTAEPEIGDLYEVGTISKVRQIFKLPTGGLRVLVEGESRGRLVAIAGKIDDFDKAVVEPLPESLPDDSLEMTALTRTVIHEFEEWVKLSKKIPAEAFVSIAITDDTPRMADIIASHLSLKLEEKQEILAAVDIRVRLEKLYAYVHRELDILAIEIALDDRFKKQVEKVQKNFYLREKIKAIHEELGDDPDREMELDELRKRLAEGDYPDEVKTAVERELKRLGGMTPYSSEAAVSRDYIEWLLSLPWRKTTADAGDLEKAAAILADDHYGLEKVKERIIEYLAVRILTKNSSDSEPRRAPILCLVGPPGVGKTSLAASIARATGRKFVRAALGGIHDEAELRGHRRTYVGALPGRIIDGLKRAGTKNPVFLLDEVDKLNSDWRGNPAAALLEILDPVQSAFFTDHYVDLPFDLSEILWIVTANSAANIPSPLRDRLEIIELSSYTAEEKLQIAKLFLVGRARKATGLTKKDISVSEAVIKRIIADYTREAGVRELERLLTRIMRKTARKIVAAKEKGEKFKLPISLKAKELEEYLDRPRYSRLKTDHAAKVGVAMGLAWTAAGGELLPIEVAVLGGKGNLILTGKLGDVMKESAAAALSYIRSRSKKWNIPLDFYEKNDIHIHVPEGAIPKDGPSAGITMATAMLSALTGRKLKGDVAMTGEITLRGRVLAIGGLKEKVLAARREAMKKVLLPKENEKDIADIPAAVQEEIEFVPVESMDEVLRHVWEK